VTIAEAVKAAGYGTYMAGKWHVTPYRGPETPKHNWPCQRGFDHFFGTIHGAGSFYDPSSLTRDNTFIPPGDDFYYTDAISDNAATYIREHQERSDVKPFFMYVAYTAAHWPMHARPEDVARYKGRYDGGWQDIRQARYKRMRRMGLLAEAWDLSPRDAKLWDEVSETDKKWHARRMEVYAAMITSMDAGIGRIVQALKETGQYENTLILFLQDNGGCAEEFGSRGKPHNHAKNLKKAEPMAPDALQTSMVPPVTRDGKPVRVGHGVMPGPADTYIAYGREWANVSNTPFRLYKHWVHEGGISTPLIAHWPASIPNGRHGKFERQPGHLIDIMATCVDLAKATYPKTYNGHEITPMQGVSLTPALLGKDVGRAEPIYFEHEGNRAIRDGKWKLVAKGATGKWELYDMEADRSELHNLAEKHPDRVRQMVARWETFARKAHMIPWPYKGKYAAKKPKRG
ncbi:MAG: sulfatase-like hydrolase/transferase, partial [Planctomycetota bacterium]|nr:sulfatase-like hydrolase/transferase [Planctomycetota bacterium]